MGAHAIPRKFINRKSEYIDQIKEDLAEIKSKLTDFVDVFL